MVGKKTMSFFPAAHASADWITFLRISSQCARPKFTSPIRSALFFALFLEKNMISEKLKND